MLDGLLDGIPLGPLDGVSLGLLDGSLDGVSLGSLEGVSVGLLDYRSTEFHLDRSTEFRSGCSMDRSTEFHLDCSTKFRLGRGRLLDDDWRLGFYGGRTLFPFIKSYKLSFYILNSTFILHSTLYICLLFPSKESETCCPGHNPTQCCPCKYILLLSMSYWHSYLCRCVCTAFHSLPRFFSLSSNVQPAG